MKPEDYNTGQKPVWCPGCGNFGILMAVRQAFAEMELKKEDTVIVSGIGCSDKYHQYIDTIGVESIHGRILPLAMGIRLANHKLKVIGIGGDGDGYGIGMCHLVHAMRRNLDVTYLVCDNQIYGLTTGQTSPTSDKGFETKSTPSGNIEKPVNPIATALSSGATFIARGFAENLEQLRELIKKGVKHKGFALIDVFQPCITFNKKNTYEWYKQNTYDLQETDHNPTDKMAAYTKAHENAEGDGKFPLGVIYKEERQTYEGQVPQIKKKALVEQDITDVQVQDLIEEKF